MRNKKVVGSRGVSYRNAVEREGTSRLTEYVYDVCFDERERERETDIYRVFESISSLNNKNYK